MKQLPQPDHAISPHVSDLEGWHSTLADGYLSSRFSELVEWTHDQADAESLPWVENRDDVSMRWQHGAMMIGHIASQHGHPLFSHGRGWTDTGRVAEVLDPIDYRSFDASFVENALVLTHSLAVVQGEIETPGISVILNIENTKYDDPDHVPYKHNIAVVDLRDMSEPTDTVVGDMSLDEYQSLSAAERGEVSERLRSAAGELIEHGRGYGINWTPQQGKYFDERLQLNSFSMITEYGTDDNGKIEDILDRLKAHEIAQKRREQPDFGKLPDGYESLPERTQESIAGIFDYFDSMRDPFDDVRIDKYSLGRMGFEDSDLEELIKNGILVDEGESLQLSGTYLSWGLAQPYYEHWVSRQYPAGEQEA